MLGARRTLIVILLILFLAVSAFAQNKEKIKYQTPTIKGSSGLFNLPTADTFRQGEFSFGLHGSKFNREPGDMDITLFPVSFTVGLHDRVELFASYEVYQRVHNNGLRVNKIAPGGTVIPSQIPGGTTMFYNDTPFMDVGFGDGSGSLWTGIKFNLMSERYGNPVGLALQPIFRWSFNNERNKLARGLSPGVNDYGFDVILSKNAGRGTFTATGGLMYAEDKAWADRQNRFNYGLGLEHPLGTPKVRIIGELVGSTFWGDRTGLANPKSPVDLYGGIRAFPARWMAVGIAYNYYLNRLDEATWDIEPTDRHGWYAEAVFQRKVNRPPVAECSAAQSSVIEGNTVSVTADVDDPDDDVLTVTWNSSGGRLSGQGYSTSFDSTGLTAGSYTVKAEVTDGENVASCSVDVLVEKNKQPPVVSCEPGTTSVTAGGAVTLNARASDPNGDALTYAWTVDGSAVTNNNPSFEFGTAGRSIGSHTVQVTVTDVDGLTASCQFAVTINQRPNNNPTVSLALDKTDVFACERVRATATASDPDGDPLTYSWRIDGQSYPGSASTNDIDTCGMSGGAHTVTVMVNDGRGGSASDSKTLNVTEKITVQVDRRVDNVAKAKLDEVAVKMQQNPNLKAVLTGHTDSEGSPEANERMGMKRAEMVKEYLVKQHNLDPGRIETRSAGATEPVADNSTAEGRKQNRRVVIELQTP